MNPRLLLLTLLALAALLLSGCEARQWLTSYATPADIARAEQVLEAAETVRADLITLSETVGMDAVAAQLARADAFVHGARAQLTELREAPEKPRWSTLVDLGLGIAAALGLTWATIAQRGKNVVEGAFRETVRGVNAVRVEAKTKPVKLEDIDERLNALSESTKVTVAKTRQDMDLRHVNA